MMCAEGRGDERSCYDVRYGWCCERKCAVRVVCYGVLRDEVAGARAVTVKNGSCYGSECVHVQGG